MSTASSTRPTDKDRQEEHGRTNFNNVREDARRLKQDITDYAGEAAHTGVEAVKSGANQALDVGRHAADTAMDKYDRVCHYVAQHPTTSILIAAGVGAVLARLIPRR